MKKQVNLKLDDRTYIMLECLYKKLGLNKTALLKLLIRTEYFKQFSDED